MINNNKWFNLIELIISISIITILAVIWYMSLLSNLIIVRDSTRIVDLENIKSGLNSYILKSWFYPNPSDLTDIFYSGWLVWSQWVFDNNIWNIIWYSENRYDPLTKTNYTYSVKKSKTEFSLAWVLENKLDVKNIAIVKWNYNWEILVSKNNLITYILAVPSIISANLISNNLIDIINNNYLVYDDYQNLPASFLKTEFNTNINIDFSSNILIVYSWSLQDLKKSATQVLLLQNIYNSYSWTLLWNKISVSSINQGSLFDSNISQDIKISACELVNNKLNFLSECSWNIWE